jgi:hypothetical protein
LQAEKKHTLAEYFNSNWESYLSGDHKPLRYEQYKAVNAICACRTEKLGIDYYACEECGEVKAIYHNCKNRFCPTCSWGDTVKWAEKLKSQMLDLPHRHVVCTLPHKLIPLIKANGKHLLNILFKTAADTFQDWALHKHNIKLGIISVLHTFGEKKDSHYHVHMIVSWGGISNETGELYKIKGDFVKHSFLANKFRCKFEDLLFEMFDKDTLVHDFKNKISFKSYLKSINQKQWVIHLEPSIPTPEAVIRYIGRYSKRACISEYKITSIEGEFISFSYKDYKTIDTEGKPVVRELRLHYTDFFPRLLQHVPLPYFRLVRYYGLYSTKNTIKEEYLNKSTETDNQEEVFESPFVCTFCNKKRVYLETIFDYRKTRTNKKQTTNLEYNPWLDLDRA